MDWTIRPREGMGPLRFGMTPAQVTTALGGVEPARTDPSWDGKAISEFRALDLPTCGYTAGLLTSIGVGPQTNGVNLSGLDVFANPPLQVLQALERANGGAIVGLGSVVFPTLQISTTNFYDEDTGKVIDPQPGRQDDRTLLLTRDDDQDGLAAHFRPVSFL